MALKTWEIKTGSFGKVVRFKGKKDDAKNFAYYVMDKAVNTAKYQTTISGVIGGEEGRSTSMLLFGGNSLANPEKWRTDVEGFLVSLPDPVTMEDVPGVKEKAQAIFDEHCPIIDQRRTPEEVAENERLIKEADERRKAESQAFIDKYCQPEPIEIPDGSMAVILQLEFDDSHGMSDYFHPHSQIGKDMLLGIVPRQAQTERLLRSVLDRYPDLQAHEWEWRTENYSGGNGNYLLSEFFDEIDHKAYDGRDKVSVRYEIRCTSYAKSVYPYKHYTAQDVRETAPGDAQTATAGAIFRFNEEKGGVEVKFSQKPDSKITTYLSQNGFRWSRFQKLWYARRTERTISVAQNVAQQAA